MQRSGLLTELRRITERDQKYYTTKIRNLEEQVKNGVSVQESAVRQVKDLEAENKSLKEQITNHTGCVCKAGQKAELEKEIARLREYNEDLRGRDRDQLGVIEELRKNLMNSEQTLLDDARRLQGLHDELSLKTAQLNESTAAINAVNQQSKLDRQKLSTECEMKATRLEQTILDLQRQVKEATNLASEKNDTARGISCELEATKRELTNAKQECVTLSREKAVADDRATKLEKQAVNLASDMASKIAELQLAQQHAQSLQDQLAETNSAIANMEERFMRIGNELEMTKTERIKASTKISELQELLKVEASKMACIDSKNQALLKELAETRMGKDATIENLEKQLTQIGRELEISKNEEMKARTKVTELQELLDVSWSKMVCTDSKHQELLKELAETRRDLVAVKMEMSNKFVLERNLLQADIGVKCKRIEELEIQLGKLGDSSKQCLEELNLMTSERNRLGEKIRRMYAEKKTTSIEQEDKRSTELQKLRRCYDKMLEEKDDLLLEKQAQVAKMLDDAVRKDGELLEARNEIQACRNGENKRESALCKFYRQQGERTRREIHRLRARIQGYGNRKSLLKDALVQTDKQIKVKVVKCKLGCKKKEKTPPEPATTICQEHTSFGPELITHFLKR